MDSVKIKSALLNIWIWITAPLVFAFIPREWDRMPREGSMRWLRFYDEFNYGLNGDEQWVNPILSDHPPTADAAREWKWRVRWCRRNANVYENEQGVDTRSIVWIEFTGNPETRNRPAPGISGDLHIKAWDAEGRLYECHYRVRQWGNSGRCLRSYRGYKLLDILDFSRAHDGRLDPMEMEAAGLRRIAQRVNTTNPLTGFAK